MNTARGESTEGGTPGRPGAARSRYVATAAEIVEIQGHTALTARAVARRLGVMPSALYAHFADMEELLDAVADDFMARLVAELTPPRTNPPSDIDDLIDVLTRYTRWFADHPHVFTLLFFRQRARAADFVDARRTWAPTFAPLVAAGVLEAEDVESVTAVIIWAIHGRLLLGLSSPDDLPAPNIARDVAAIARSALLQKRTPPQKGSSS